VLTPLALRPWLQMVEEVAHKLDCKHDKLKANLRAHPLAIVHWRLVPRWEIDFALDHYSQRIGSVGPSSLPSDLLYAAKSVRVSIEKLETHFRRRDSVPLVSSYRTLRIGLISLLWSRCSAVG
jgi:hypothetical protein